MKKSLLILLLILFASGVYLLWEVLGPNVHTPAEKYFYVPTGSSYSAVEKSLIEEGIIRRPLAFKLLSKRLKYDKKIRPGRYEITQGMSVLDLVRMLKAGRQSPVRLVINKIRTREDLAGKLGRQFEIDSLELIKFLSNNDSLARYQRDTNTMMTIIIPNSYLFWWNSSLRNLFDRLSDQERKFWEGKRTRKAQLKNLTNSQVYTMASIVEEETNKQEDKGLIASVYMNRLRMGMKLEADPTVKYSLRDFGIKRILHGHLDHPSPYNTYMNKGLPPGPICTPSTKTIDAVLDAPETDYIFFVAKPDFNGYSNFASTYAQHLVFAKAYQRALDTLIQRRNAQ